MKTATITWITYKNYGTVLQAYSLQSYIKSMGYCNEIISDYYIICPNQNNNTTKSIDSVPKKAKKESKDAKIKRRINKLLSNPFKFIIHIFQVLFKTIKNKRIQKKYLKAIETEKRFYESQKIFDEFKKTNIDVVEGYPKEKTNLLSDKYDVFICGSDQIWSVFERNFNGYYFLDFTHGKKISYAASLGTTDISEEKIKKIKNYLSDFSYVSVREKASAEQLEKVTNQKIEWVCDPTLLYDSVFWSNFCSSVIIPKKKYLLCYFLEDNDWYFEYAKDLAKFLKLKLLIIPSRIQFMEKKGVYNQPVGPKEFVALFKQADFVLTDSYHGSIFSFIFSKKLIYLKRFEDNDEFNQNIRVESLFGLLNINDIIISNKRFEKKDIKKLDYNIIQNILSEFRVKSGLFLERGLND